MSLLSFRSGQQAGDPENEQYNEDGPQGFSRDIATHGDYTNADADDDMEGDEDDNVAKESEPSDAEDLDDNIDA